MTGAARLDPGWLRLIAVTDSLRDGVEGLTRRTRHVVEGGATMIQLRLPEESPRTLAHAGRALIAAMPGVPVLVSGRADVALAIGAHGVHLAVNEMPAAALRAVVPDHFLIGASASEEAHAALVAGADYVGIGPVFGAGGELGAAGALGAERFGELARMCALPAIAIGGMTRETVPLVLREGAAGVAAISALFRASDPASAARALVLAQDASGR